MPDLYSLQRIEWTRSTPLVCFEIDEVVSHDDEYSHKKTQALSCEAGGSIKPGVAQDEMGKITAGAREKGDNVECTGYHPLSRALLVIEF